MEKYMRFSKLSGYLLANNEWSIEDCTIEGYSIETQTRHRRPFVLTLGAIGASGQTIWEPYD